MLAIFVPLMFSGPGRAIGPMCVCVRKIISELSYFRHIHSWHADICQPKAKFEDESHKVVVCRGICANIVAATSSDGFLVS